MKKSAIAFLVACLLVGTSAHAKDKPKKATLGDLDCTIDQITKYSGTEWVCSEDVSSGSKLVVVDAAGTNVGSPAWIDGGTAYLLFDYENSFLSVPVDDQGFAFDIPFLFAAENCLGEVFSQSKSPPRHGLTIGAIGAPNGEILTVPPDPDQTTLDVVSQWDPQSDPYCSLVAIEADIAAVFTLSLPGTPLDQCRTEDAGLDNTEPFGVRMFVDPNSGNYPEPEPKFEPQELINIGGNVLMASFVASNLADFYFYLGSEDSSLQCVNGDLDGAVTDIDIEYNVACNFDEQFDDGRQDFWVSATDNAEPLCYSITIQPIYNQLLVPRRTKRAFPTMATGLSLPDVTPPLTLEVENDN